MSFPLEWTRKTIAIWLSSRLVSVDGGEFRVESKVKVLVGKEKLKRKEHSCILKCLQVQRNSCFHVNFLLQSLLNLFLYFYLQKGSWSSVLKKEYTKWQKSFSAFFLTRVTYLYILFQYKKFCTFYKMSTLR